MAKEKPPPPRRSNPDYNPDAPAREELGDDHPRTDEYQPDRNRNLPSMAVLITVVAVVVLAAFYFLGRG